MTKTVKTLKFSSELEDKNKVRKHPYPHKVLQPIHYVKQERSLTFVHKRDDRKAVNK